MVEQTHFGEIREMIGQMMVVIMLAADHSFCLITDKALSMFMRSMASQVLKYWSVSNGRLLRYSLITGYKFHRKDAKERLKALNEG